MCSRSVDIWREKKKSYTVKPVTTVCSSAVLCYSLFFVNKLLEFHHSSSSGAPGIPATSRNGGAAVANRSWRTVVNIPPDAPTQISSGCHTWRSHIKAELHPTHRCSHANVFRQQFWGGGKNGKKNDMKIKNASKQGEAASRCPWLVHPARCLTLGSANNIKLRATNKPFCQGSVCREECNLMLHVYPGPVSLKRPVS